VHNSPAPSYTKFCTTNERSGVRVPPPDLDIFLFRDGISSSDGANPLYGAALAKKAEVLVGERGRT